MLELAGVEPHDVVYDLGCGDGRMVVTAARRYGARAVGIDMNPKMIARARANAERGNVVDKASFIEGDLFEADLTPATVVTLFLWPTMNVRLRPRLLDLAPGTRIVSHEHDMGDWKPDRTMWVDTRMEQWGDRDLHLWVVPAQIGGSWRLSVDDRVGDAKIEQRYQRFSGSAAFDGRSQPIRNGRINGAEVRFDLAVSNGKPRRYVGRVTPDGGIEGEGWRAARTQ